MSKTSIFFSRNTSQGIKNSGISGLSKAHRIDTYLGLPTFVGKSRTQSFKNIIEKVSKRLENWKCSFL
jgi:hypothetical protein